MARVTLKQLAEHVGLSTTTVSDVVRGKGTSRVSEETRRRILDAAERLGYRSNRLSRALRTQRSQIIGMLSSGLPAASTSRERFAALERSLAAHDYVASFALHHSEEAALGRALDTFQDLCVDAIVTEWLDTPLERLLAARLAGAGIPVVSFGPFSELDYHYVGTDYAVGGRLVVEHLFRQGCRRFAFVHQALRGLNLRPREQRVQGYRAAYEELVGPWSDAPVIVVPYKGDVTSVGLTAAEELLHHQADGRRPLPPWQRPASGP